jgi:hypothetical protein
MIRKSLLTLVAIAAFLTSRVVTYAQAGPDFGSGLSILAVTSTFAHRPACGIEH